MVNHWQTAGLLSPYRLPGLWFLAGIEMYTVHPSPVPVCSG